MASPAQIRAIKALQRRVGLDDANYRGLLEARTGCRSARDLNDGAALRIIDELRGLAGQGPVPRDGPARAGRATGKYAPVLQALWISAWHLGIVRSRDDRALLAFVERQTCLAHTRFLTDPADAARAIEGLKAWIARAGDVDWPTDRDADGIERKWAVARAVVRRLHAAGGFQSLPGFARLGPDEDPWPAAIAAYGHGRGLPATFGSYGADEWDQLIAWLGGRLRTALVSGKAAAGRAS